MLFYKTVSPRLVTLLKELVTLNETKDFVLVGGTCLSLQIGHRMSVDIDLFTDKIFDIQQLQIALQERYTGFAVNWQNKNGFTCLISDVKVDFFNWHTPFCFPLLEEDRLRLANKLEIAAMKFETITTRKEKKDFFDIAFLLQEFSLEQLITAFKKRYPFLGHTMVLESLMAVDLADESLNPVLIENMDWTTVKKIITDNVQAFFVRQRNVAEMEKENRIRKAEELLKKKPGGENL